MEKGWLQKSRGLRPGPVKLFTIQDNCVTFAILLPLVPGEYHLFHER